jgi:multiple sugar transport system ATP-binding protein
MRTFIIEEIFPYVSMAESFEQSQSQATRTANERSGNPVIDIQNMTKTFDRGEIVACEDVNLEIYQEDFVVLLGPSGCGKTTTLRCISGLEIPTEGTILINGTDMTGVKPKNRNLAFVFQSVALFPHMNVRRNIRFGLDMTTDLTKDEKNERVEGVANILGIETMLDRDTSELSGGQQQRVSLGRAMVMEPDAFLLDEPFSALDANLRKTMQTEVKELQRRLETPMVFVTHDQEEAMAIGDKIVVMNEGHIQQVGSPHEIFNEPTKQFIAQFIGSPTVNMFDGVVTKSSGETRIETDLFTIPADDERSDQLAADQDVRLGVRPQYVSQTDGGKGVMTGEVALVEPQDDRDTVVVDVDGTSVRTVVPQGTMSAGERVELDFGRDEFWLFDRDGDRIY